MEDWPRISPGVESYHTIPALLKARDISLPEIRIENPAMAKIPFASVSKFLMKMGLDMLDEDAVQDYRTLGSSSIDAALLPVATLPRGGPSPSEYQPPFVAPRL